MPKIEVIHYQSPLGVIALTRTEAGIIALNFFDQTSDRPAPDKQGGLTTTCTQQLDDYFSGRAKIFSIPLIHLGTPFQNSVWEALHTIPYGATCSYADIARKIGNPNSVRAVANAVAANPTPIIIPCHRVIGSDGSLTGYSGGLWRKKWLLEHEKRGVKKCILNI